MRGARDTRTIEAERIDEKRDDGGILTWKKMIPQATRKIIQKTRITPGLWAAQLSAIYH
jgi:hypothetical protein